MMWEELQKQYDARPNKVENTDSFGVLSKCNSYRHEECSRELPKFGGTGRRICTCTCHTKQAD